jgi:hypothetical protein
VVEAEVVEEVVEVGVGAEGEVVVVVVVGQ